jgi:hypothetical protein
MSRARALTSLIVVGILMMSLSGCGSTSARSGKVRISGQRMCEAHGGTYNKQTRHCTYPTQARSARSSCAAQGGYYDEADICEMGQE